MPELEVLSTFRGDKKIFVDDTDEDGREKFAETIMELMKQGNVVFLIEDGYLAKRITGYDPETNEWLLEGPAVSIEKKGRATASKTKATAIKRASGG